MTAVNQPAVNQPAVNQPAVNQPAVNQPAVNQPRVILDLQALQNPQHATRGIGRWAQDFTLALCGRHPDLVAAILLNPDLAPPTDVAALAATGKLHAGGGPPAAGSILHVLSPFELDVDLGHVWPEWAIQAGHALVVTLYDLIPLVFPGRYLADPAGRRRYRTRLELVRAADAVLAISEATRQDAISLLGLPAEQIVAVGTGIAPAFGPPASRGAALAAAREAVPGLAGAYLLCVGGEDDRKNIEGVLAGYARLPAALAQSHQLVVTCGLSDGYRRHLQAVAAGLGIAERVLLTGFVPDDALIPLYQAAELFVFASLYEGFGLPVAEAMACGTPAIASGVSALAEVADPAGWFDPADSAAIAGAMVRALTDPATRAALAAAAQAPVPAWAQVVDRAAAVYRRLAVPAWPGPAGGATMGHLIQPC